MSLSLLTWRAPQDHRHTLTLLNHFTVAASHGNAHASELLAAGLAVNLRLHNQVQPRGVGEVALGRAAGVCG